MMAALLSIFVAPLLLPFAMIFEWIKNGFKFNLNPLDEVIAVWLEQFPWLTDILAWFGL
ncbi:MAG: hypothetical protein LBB75_05730 [Oscillospiraceae bacterium]|jgi:hypothetical protein|nr:hypothetical protein [Oscillospiraceae bacterium]